MVKRLTNVTRNPGRSRRGITLPQVALAFAVVGGVGVLGLGAMSWYEPPCAYGNHRLQIGEIAKRVELYSLKEGVLASSFGLKEIYGGEEVPKDTWGNDFIFVRPGPNGAPFDLISLGSDGAVGGTNDAADLKWSERHTW